MTKCHKSASGKLGSLANWWLKSNGLTPSLWWCSPHIHQPLMVPLSKIHHFIYAEQILCLSMEYNPYFPSMRFSMIATSLHCGVFLHKWHFPTHRCINAGTIRMSRLCNFTGTGDFIQSGTNFPNCPGVNFSTTKKGQLVLYRLTTAAMFILKR